MALEPHLWVPPKVKSQQVASTMQVPPHRWTILHRVGSFRPAIGRYSLGRHAGRSAVGDLLGSVQFGSRVPLGQFIDVDGLVSTKPPFPVIKLG
jgi:hypothetical protein